MGVNTPCMTYSESGQPTGGGPCAEFEALRRERDALKARLAHRDQVQLVRQLPEFLSHFSHLMAAAEPLDRLPADRFVRLCEHPTGPQSPAGPLWRQDAPERPFRPKSGYAEPGSTSPR